MDVKPTHEPERVDEGPESAPPALIEAIKRGLADVAAGRVVEGRSVVARLRRQASKLRAERGQDGPSRGHG